MRRGAPWPIAAVLLLALFATTSPAPAAPLQETARGILEDAVRLLRDGEALDALLEIERALARDPALWEGHLWQGRALQALGDDLGARDAFLRATEMAPGNADAHFLAAAASLRVADFEVAWDQAIVAAQAGQPEAGRLLDALAEVDPPPGDLRERLESPRIAVTAAPGVPADLLRVVRRAVVDAPRLGLVLESTERRIELERQDDGLWLRLRGAGEPPLLERRIDTAKADVAGEVAEAVQEIEAMLSTGREGDS